MLQRRRTQLVLTCVVAACALLVVGLTGSSAATSSPTSGYKPYQPRSWADIRGVGNQNPSGEIPSVQAGLASPAPCSGTNSLIPLYVHAGTVFNVPWRILAGINQIETDFGCNLNTSSAGAVGWMQFMPSTWRSYGMDANGDGNADPMDPVDAIFSAARYLDASGASSDIYKAILSYNHADWYVRQVLQNAKDFHGLSGSSLAAATDVQQKMILLQSRIADAGNQTAVAYKQLQGLKSRLGTFKAKYQQVSGKLVGVRDQLSGLEGQSNKLIKQYVDVAYYSDVSQASSASSSQDLLSYAVDSSTPQEAVVIYETAKTLMQNRQFLLRNVQDVASTTRTRRNDLATQTQRRQLLLLQESRDVQSKAQSIAALKIARKVLSEQYKGMVKQQFSYALNYKGLTGGSIGIYGYAFPLEVTTSVQRVDRGQDLESTVHGPFLALGNGVIQSGAEGFPGVTLKLADGPAKGEVVFYGHTYKSYVKHGDHVLAGQVLGLVGHQGASYDGDTAHVEVGFLTPSGQVAPIAGPHHWASTGTAMHQLLHAIRPDIITDGGTGK